MAKSGLTAKQRLFCQEYLVDLNATQAAIRAGYSEKTAHVQGPRLLENVSVQEEIKRLVKMKLEKIGVRSDRVLEELAKLAFSNMKDFASWHSDSVMLKRSEELTDEQAACIAEVSSVDTKYGTNLKFKLHDKKGALELLGKYLTLFVDKSEVEHKGQVEVVFNIRRPPKEPLEVDEGPDEDDTANRHPVQP